MTVVYGSMTGIGTHGLWVDHAPEDDVREDVTYADGTRVGTLSVVPDVETVGPFLTDGRQALLAYLQNNDVLSANVTTWFDWGAGIRKRYNLEPATCPLVSVVPADVESDDSEDTNVLDAYPQMVEVGVATAGQNAESCEELVVKCLDVIRAANRDCMGLAEDGLNSVRLVDAAFAADPKEEGAKIVWLAALTVRLAWRI